MCTYTCTHAYSHINTFYIGMVHPHQSHKHICTYIHGNVQGPSGLLCTNIHIYTHAEIHLYTHAHCHTYMDSNLCFHGLSGFLYTDTDTHTPTYTHRHVYMYTWTQTSVPKAPQVSYTQTHKHTYTHVYT